MPAVGSFNNLATRKQRSLRQQIGHMSQENCAKQLPYDWKMMLEVGRTSIRIQFSTDLLLFKVR